MRSTCALAAVVLFASALARFSRARPASRSSWAIRMACSRSRSTAAIGSPVNQTTAHAVVVQGQGASVHDRGFRGSPSNASRTRRSSADAVKGFCRNRVPG